ncbi:hypothetical protein [Elioraea thermophila]|uniref:hypothetical protein n=1 Tax=Elioraea thermophila TaxID=2185104 RepID=UPI000DF148EC|nr:hypothetical protein [Elioraea thermophila]
MPRHSVVLLGTEEGRRLVARKCREAGVRFAAFEELVEAELDQQGKKKKKGLWEEFDRILEEIEVEKEGG